MKGSVPTVWKVQTLQGERFGLLSQEGCWFGLYSLEGSDSTVGQFGLYSRDGSDF